MRSTSTERGNGDYATQFVLPTVQWSDGTAYQNGTNGEYTIQSADPYLGPLHVECGAYHTHILYPIGTRAYNASNPSATHHQVWDPDKQIWTWKTLLVNGGRNTNGELCRGYITDDTHLNGNNNTLNISAVIFGGKVSPDRLYLYDLSSRVYHSVIVASDPGNSTEIIDGIPSDKIWRPGKTYSCGTNHYGQLARNTISWIDPILSEISIGNIKKVRTGWGTTALVDKNSELYTCGANYCNQLGRLSDNGVYSNTNLSNNNVQVNDVQFGSYHILYLTTDNEVYSAGLADSGALCINNSNGSPENNNLANVGYYAEVICAGYSYSGFLTPSPHRFLCAGNNNHGQLGRDAETEYATTGQVVETNLGETFFFDTIDGKSDIISKAYISLAYKIPEGEESEWKTWHIKDGIETDYIYTSLFASQIPDNQSKLLAFSLCTADDILTSGLDERYTVATPRNAQISVRNIGKMYEPMSWETLVMMRIIAMFRTRGTSEDISYFFDYGDSIAKSRQPLIQVEGTVNEYYPLYIDGIKPIKVNGDNRNFDYYLSNQYLTENPEDIPVTRYDFQNYTKVITYEDMDDGIKYTETFWCDNDRKLLPKTFTSNASTSGIDMSQVGNLLADTGMMKVSVKDRFIFTQVSPNDENEKYPFYFVAYIDNKVKDMQVGSRYDVEPIGIRIE